MGALVQGFRKAMLNRSHQKILMIGIGVCLVFSAILAYGMRRVSRSGVAATETAKTRQTIARVDYAGAETSAKARGQVAWRKLKKDANLFDGDRIRVEKGAGTLLHFPDGTEIALNEESELEVDQRGVQFAVTLKRGRVFCKSGMRTSFHIAQNYTAQPLAAFFTLEAKDKNEIALSVTKGKVTLRNPNKTFVLTPGDRLLIDSQGAPTSVKEEVSLMLPNDSEFIPIGGSTHVVTLKWKPPVPAIYNWEVAETSAFKHLVASGKSHDGVANVRLAPRVYYWRVSDENQKAVSPIARFTISAIPQIEPVAPEREKRVIAGDASEQFLEFNWQIDPKEDASDYLNFGIELSRSEKFNDQTVRRITDVSFVESFSGKRLYRGIISKPAQELLAGFDERKAIWHWRVIAWVPRNIAAIAQSLSNSFVVERESGLPTARLVHPADQATRLAGEKRVHFSWSPVPGSEEFGFFIWPSDTVRPPRPTLVTKLNHLALNRTDFVHRTNLYDWTVVPINKNGEFGGFSRKRSVRVIASASPNVVELVSPLHGHQYRMSEAQPIEFNWKPAPGAVRYVLTIERLLEDEKWQTTVEKTFEKTMESYRYTWTPESSGAYRWSVVGIDEVNRPGQRSTVREIEVLKAQASKLSAPRVVQEH